MSKVSGYALNKACLFIKFIMWTIELDKINIVLY